MYIMFINVEKNKHIIAKKIEIAYSTSYSIYMEEE